MKNHVSVFGLLLLMQVALNATTYYVSSSGSDTTAGSELAPWKSISKAAATVTAGDTVLVTGGFYPEHVRLTRSGTSENRITFKAVQTVRVGGIFVQAAFNTIGGFEIAGETVQLWDGALRLDGGARNVWIVNNRFHDMTNRYGITMDVVGKLPADGPQSCIFSNNIFDQIGYINLNLYGANHLVISNTFENSFGEGDAIRAWGAGHRIVSNTLTNIGGGTGNAQGHPDLIQTFGDNASPSYDIVFERNLAINCLSQFCQLEQKGVPDIRDWTFRNNLFINVAYAANCDLPGVWWYNNTFYRCTTNTGHVIFFSDDVVFKGAAWRSGAINNVFLECGSNPANNTFGWYGFQALLTDMICDYNYVGGAAFASKRTDAVRSVFRFVEPHGINGGDPGFVSLETLDFHLRPDSPLRNAGVSLGSFKNDYANEARDAVYDVGAIEYIDPGSITDIKLSASSSIQNNLRIEVSGLPGSALVLQTSTQLSTWQDVQTNVGFSGRWTADLPIAGDSVRFYRVKRF